ncbi:hypothetical protein B0H16DRAFT_1779761 [Mycena metata]|uniref:Uncharacterized protein n=1 Tax=Mycena metata TaxID=1033252 RepID=A0AAD7HTK2_9AGAR|nr:hypothetical protein B0H16DRAFT_1779761 [Mycena metata]
MSKKKSKSQQTRTLVGRTDLAAELITVARISTSPEALITEISRLLDVPDYDTKGGLKQCHQDFDKISSKLEIVFAQTRESQSDTVSADRLAAGIIAIYGRMSQDNLMRKRIVAETNFLQKAISLLRSPVAQSIVMAALSGVTHLADTEIMRSIARFTSTILDCVEDHLDDIQYAEKALCVLSHCTVVDTDPELARLIPLPRVLQFFLSVVRLPTSTSLSFDHFLVFCSRTTGYHSAIFHSLPDSVDFLVACTRAKDICARNDALRSLIALFPGNGITQFTAALPHVDAALRQYGANSNLDREFLEVHARFELVDDFVQDPHRSLSDFGNKLVDLIMAQELGVRRHFQDPGDDELDDGGIRRLQEDLGCSQFVDVLRLCAEAVRSGSGPQAEINGDILQLEFPSGE